MIKSHRFNVSFFTTSLLELLIRAFVKDIILNCKKSQVTVNGETIAKSRAVLVGFRDVMALPGGSLDTQKHLKIQGKSADCLRGFAQA